MALNSKKTLILAKVEATYGDDPTPTASADALIAYDVEITPEIDPLERDDRTISLGRRQELGGKRRTGIKFTTELRGSGTAGTAPKGDSALFKSVAFGETIVPATSVTYAPVSASFQSATLYVYMDGVLHHIHGAVGDLEIVFEAGETPKLNWDLKGLFEDYTDVAFPGSYTPNTTKPVVCKNMTATIDSYAAVIRKLSIKLGNQIAERPSLAAATGVAGFQVVDRKVEGEIVIEAIAKATKDLGAKWIVDTLMALNIVLNGGAGNIATLASSYCRLRQIPWKNEDRIMTNPIAFQLARSSANDEMTLALT